MRDKEFKKITEYFGIDNQIVKLNEEVAELTVECARDNYFGIQEELVDTLILLKQIKLYFNISDEEIVSVSNEKNR
jgi:NTP pyrophosphatase (non-canonical NTP hydrolase)